MSIDVAALLEPIAGDDPVGPDLRSETGMESIYFKLKDARAQARTIERATEAAGENPIVPPEWQTVRSLATEALQTKSKDLEIAAWLLEAELRLDGFAGLATGFTLIEGLAKNFWPALHSIDEDDVAGRVSPLSGLNGLGSDGALIQPIRMVPLLPESSYGTHALWHLTRSQKEPDSSLGRSFNDARASIGMTAIRERAIQASGARDAFAKLTAELEALCGPDAPPSSNIRNALDDVLDAYRALVGGGADLDAKSPVADAAATPASSSANGSVETPPTPEPRASAPTGGPRELRTREEAFTELLRIADFFRRNEPHSPISYALETLVWRGRMSFIDLWRSWCRTPAAANSCSSTPGFTLTQTARGPDGTNCRAVRYLSKSYLFGFLGDISWQVFTTSSNGSASRASTSNMKWRPRGR